MINEETIQLVWNAAKIVEGYDPVNIRQDACGAWIVRNHYGMRDSDYGWEIDHVYPISLGGDDQLDNLRAMQWENNLAKGDDYPTYHVCVQSSGSHNIHVQTQFTVNEVKQGIIRNLYSI